MPGSVTGARKKRREEDGTARKARRCAMERASACWSILLGVERLVGGRSTAKKMKGKLEKIDKSSKTSTEITDLVVIFVKL